MPPTKRKITQAVKISRKKKVKKSKDEEEEEEFSDGFESPISEHLEEPHENSGSDTTPAVVSAESYEEILLAGDEVLGEVLISGGYDWNNLGKKSKQKASTSENLYGPHRLSSLKGKSVRSITTGCMSHHSFVITEEKKIYGWGRNDYGQLGLGDTELRNIPTPIPTFEDLTIVMVACGKSHTLFLTEKGQVYSVGNNASGQLGIGKVGSVVDRPVKVRYTGPPIKHISCGSEFSAVVDVQGNLHTFGSPEYGQLGHNSDGKYFVSSSKMSYDFKTSPLKVKVYLDKGKDGDVSPMKDVVVETVSCGQNHMVAMDTKGRLYTWGFGGYGRLGHADNKDELVPRLLRFFDGPNRGAALINTGSSFSMAVSQTGLLYLWGQTKSSGEASMYPKPVQDLFGWKIRSVACCFKSIVIAAENSVVSWGSSPTYGELCLGNDAPRSSTTPQECQPLHGVYVHKVSGGWGHTLLLARNQSDEEKALIDKLPVFTA